MRIGTKVIHNLDNEVVVIMDESSANEVVFTVNEYKQLLSNGCSILHEHKNVPPTLITP